MGGENHNSAAVESLANFLLSGGFLILPSNHLESPGPLALPPPR